MIVKILETANTINFWVNLCIRKFTNKFSGK